MSASKQTGDGDSRLAEWETLFRSTKRQRITVIEAIDRNLRNKILMSLEDADLLQVPWHINKRDHRYSISATYRKPAITVHLSRVILRRMIGRDLLPGEQCDHISGESLDNRRENLRCVSAQENHMNRKRSSKPSGLIGVWHDGKWGKISKWKAQLTKRINGKTVVLLRRYFRTKQQAIDAYNQAAADNGFLTRANVNLLTEAGKK